MSLLERFLEIRESVARWGLGYISRVDADDMGVRVAYNAGAFEEAVAGITYRSEAGVADWTRVVVPALFYGAKLKNGEQGRVFIMGSDEGIKGLPDGVYCWEGDRKFVERLFEYVPLRSASGLFHVAVMPYVHAKGWIEVRPLGEYPDPLLMVWLLSALNMAWSHALGNEAAEIFPAKNLLEGKPGKKSGKQT
ncbi:MAG: hypothetical protein RAK25_03410 [TACK group archaeon]|nr:hypothetical protein [TACK group archaeon]